MTHFLPYQQRNNQKLFPMENCYQYIKNFHFYYYFFLYLNTNHKKLSNIWRKLKTINWMKIYNYGETSTFYCIIWRFNGKLSFFSIIYCINSILLWFYLKSIVWLPVLANKRWKSYCIIISWNRQGEKFSFVCIDDGKICVWRFPFAGYQAEHLNEV